MRVLYTGYTRVHMCPSSRTTKGPINIDAKRFACGDVQATDYEYAFVHIRARECNYRGTARDIACPHTAE